MKSEVASSVTMTPWTGYIVTHHGVTCYKNGNTQLLQE